MSNPFKKITKNSEETKMKWEGVKTGSKISTTACKCCGAPRPKNTDLTNCDYCGFKFMDIDTKIKSDT